MDHFQEVHNYDPSRDYIARREIIRKYQNSDWEIRREELSERLDANARRMRRQYEDFADKPKITDVPTATTDAQLQQQWKQLMEVDDDSDDERNEVVLNPDHDTRVDGHGLQRAKTAPRSAGQRYAPIADRTTQATTIVERTTVSGLRQDMLIPATSKDVGWDDMAETGFTPAGGREMREDRQDQNVGENHVSSCIGGLTDSFTETHDPSGGEPSDVVEAASILVSMSKSQAVDQHRQYTELEI